MTSEHREETTGTWMRGADGGLYFIPDADLETFRVPDELADPVLQEIDAGGDAAGYAATGGLSPLGADAIPILTVHGPLGIRDLAAAPAIIPPPAALRGLRLEK